MDSSAANRDNNCERYEGVQLKRQRVSEACTRCRERKQRCDGLRPACAPCRSRGLAEACRYVGTRRPAAGAGQRNSREGRDPSLSLGSSSSSNGGGSGTTVESPRRSGESSSGPLSTAAFLRQILSDYDPESSSRTSQQTTGEVSQSSNGRHSDILSDRSPEEGISLSPEEILPSTITNLQFPTGAFDFIHCYWNFVHPFFPILHMIKFVKRYCATRMAELAASDPANSESQPEDSPPDKIFMSITNLVFALGCKLSERVPDRDKASMADLFYRNSRDLACDSTLDSATLESTQMLLLTGVYLQSTQHADRCWNTIGLAIRVAQGLGLDTEPDKLRKGPQLPREMSRRIWHTCVNLDRLVAMTCGRPTMIRSANQVPFPVIVDDEYLLDQYEGTQPNDVPCRFGLFPTASTLLELLKEVLELHSKYNPARVQEQLESANEKKKLVTSVMELNRRLDILSASIPEYLKENTANNPLGPHRGEIQVQRHILLCRFLFIRSLLLRLLLLPAVALQQHTTPSSLLDGNANAQSMLDNVLIQQSSKKCINTSYQLIDAVYAKLDEPYHQSDGHCVYFTFSSALILLASRRCNMFQSQMEQSNHEAHWQRSILILNHYRDRIESAGPAICELRNAQTLIFSDITISQGQSNFSGDRPSQGPLNDDFVVHQNLLTAPPEPEEGFLDHQSTEEYDSLPIDGFPDLYSTMHSMDLEWLKLFQ